MIRVLRGKENTHPQLRFGMTPEFVEIERREHVLENMRRFLYVEPGEAVFRRIMSLNGKDVNSSIQGYLFESLFEILILSKCLNGVSYSKMYQGQLSALVPITQAKQILKHKLHQGGNVSDITIKTDDGTTIAFSVKHNKDRISTDKSDVGKIKRQLVTDIAPAPYKVGLMVKDRSDIKRANYQGSDSNIVLEQVKSDGLLFDTEDCIRGLDTFKRNYLTSLINPDRLLERINEDCLLVSRKRLVKKLHQEVTLRNCIHRLSQNAKMLCVAHKPRSGKSITILLICKHLLDTEKAKRILIMTSVPNTLKSFEKDLDEHIEFKGIHFKRQHEFESIDADFSGIVFCSTQYLKIDGKKNNKKELLIRMNFDAMVMDECHIGGATEKTRDGILRPEEPIQPESIQPDPLVDGDSAYNVVDEIQRTIQLKIIASGTAEKTCRYYRIPPANIFEWEIEDESIMKQLHAKEFVDEKMIDDMSCRHGNVFRECIRDHTLNRDYREHPAQVLLKASLPESIVSKIRQYNERNPTAAPLGFDCASLFALRDKKVNDPKTPGKIIVEYTNEFAICSDHYGEELLKAYLEHIISNDGNEPSIMKTIQKTQSDYGSRKSTKKDPLMVIVYLPLHTGSGNIYKLQEALKSFIVKHGLWQEYHVETSNGQDTHDGNAYVDFIQTCMDRTKTQGKIGCVLFLGNQGSVGITYNDCDVTISLDNGSNIDNQKQRFSRALTVAPNKTIGINVDMNIQRTYSYVLDKINRFRKYSKTKKTNAEILVYLHEIKMFLFNPHEFNNGRIAQKEILSYYESEMSRMIETIDDQTILDKILCDDLLKDYLTDSNFQRLYCQPQVNEVLYGDQSDVPTGKIDKVVVDTIPKPITPENPPSNPTTDAPVIPAEEIKEVINQTYELCRTVLFPLLALISRAFGITIFINIFTDKRTQPLIYNLLEEKKIDLNESKYIVIINTVNIIIDQNMEIVHNIREIYKNAQPDRLRDLISKHFIPTAEERKDNAEVPTPVSLVDEMLDKIPTEYWKTPNKTLEPCCGKGNFVLGIFDRFWRGLAESIPDKPERSRVIMTQCIYYADLTALNVFITTEIMKCHVQKYTETEDIIDYTFNTYTGNTLTLNIANTWSVNGFHSVIGNPPYNNELWSKFVEFSIGVLMADGYLLYIHPCNWRKPEHSIGKLMKSYDIKYLRMYSIKDTFRLFKCNVRTDLYLLQKRVSTIFTEIIDDMNVKYQLDIKSMDFIPNNIIHIIHKVLSKNVTKMEIVRSHKIVSNSKSLLLSPTSQHRYGVLCNLNSKSKCIKYTDRPHEIHNKPKVLMSYSLNLYPFYDESLSPTEHTFYHLVKDEMEGNKLVNYLNSSLFKGILQSSKWIGYQTDHKVFQYLPNIVNEIDIINNANIYSYFNLTEDEIRLLEKYV